MLDAVPLFVQLLQGRVHALAREVADFQALDELVSAGLAGHRVAVEDAFRNAVAAVGGHAHAHPGARFAAEHPVVDMVDRRVGRARRRGQAAPRFCTVGMKLDSSQAWSLIMGQTFLPSHSALKRSGYWVAEWLPQTVTFFTAAFGLPILAAIWEVARLWSSRIMAVNCWGFRLGAFFIAM